MRQLEFLSAQPTLGDVIRAFPAVMEPIVHFQEALMSGPSPFSKAERELLAAYVSGLNSCSFCYDAHAAIAKQFGIEKPLLESLVETGPKATPNPRMKPVLAYVNKLTTNPSRIVDADKEAILDAGWNDDAIFFATAVCGCFSLINRMAQGLSFATTKTSLNAAAKTIAENGYAKANNVSQWFETKGR